MIAMVESVLHGGVGAWQEWLSIRFEDAPLIQESDDVLVLDAHSIEFEAGTDVIVASSRVLHPGAFVGRNQWPDAMPAPRRPESQVSADRPLADVEFWAILKQATPGYDGTQRKLREILAGKDPDAVLAFQVTLVAKARELVGDACPAWERAGYTILRADPDFFEGVLSQRLAPPRAGMAEFEDLTDIAEEVLGLSIEVPGFGSSRSSQRDTPHVLPPEVREHPLFRDESLNIPEWEQLPWRWATWRVITSAAEERRETVVFANRLWGESIGAATEKVLQHIDDVDGPSIELVEHLDPRLAGPKKGMPPNHYFEFDGQGTAEQFRIARGYPPPASDLRLSAVAGGSTAGSAESSRAGCSRSRCRALRRR